MAQRIQVRRDTKSNWESNNPILGQGEIGLDLTGFRFKIGDGSTAWNLIRYDTKAERLEANVLSNTTKISTYTDGVLTQVVWKNPSDVTIRTDTFGYVSDSTTETVTETRTLPTSETLVIVSVFDLDGNYLSGSSTSSI